jgi:hypothetical protein
MGGLTRIPDRATQWAPCTAFLSPSRSHWSQLITIRLACHKRSLSSSSKAMRLWISSVFLLGSQARTCVMIDIQVCFSSLTRPSASQLLGPWQSQISVSLTWSTLTSWCLQESLNHNFSRLWLGLQHTNRLQVSGSFRWTWPGAAEIGAHWS